jgi:hypothetical protein
MQKGGLKIALIGGAFSAAVVAITTRDYTVVAIAIGLSIIALIALARDSGR